MQLKFPNSFHFSIGDADLQVVGEDFSRKYENSEQTMWDFFAKSTNKTPPGIGIDRYHKWREDIETMKQLGVKEYRTSISMSRTMHKNGDANKEALKWYKEYFQALKQNDINLYVTLYHWELPQYLSDIGGWTNKQSIEYFQKHVAIVKEELGEYIDFYFILNEPWCSSILSYFLGIFAPGERNLNHALIAAHNLLLAQGLVYRDLIKHIPANKIGTVYNTESYYSYSLEEKDIYATNMADGVYNRWFFDPTYLGKYPEDVVELFGKDMPNFTDEDMKIIKIGDKLHALGINYYSGNIIKYNKNERLKFSAVPIRIAEKNDLGWPILTPPYYPEGMYDILTQIYNTYKHHGLQRIYITENGTAVKSNIEKDGSIHDMQRIDYLQKHIHLVWKALSRGVPIEKYFAWTLMDNFEWAEGYRPESAFGLIYVDRKTMKRVWKESAYWYQNLIKSRQLKI